MLNVAALVLAGGLALAGCTSKESGAREEFSRDFTCPPERVDVRARGDLKPADFLKPATPSPEVAADAERLKLWQAQQDKQREDANPFGYEVFEARGCAHQTLYFCRRGKRVDTILCSAKEYPPGASRW
jgi:hypothetical protein